MDQLKIDRPDKCADAPMTGWYFINSSVDFRLIPCKQFQGSIEYGSSLILIGP